MYICTKQPRKVIQYLREEEVKTSFVEGGGAGSQQLKKPKNGCRNWKTAGDGRQPVARWLGFGQRWRTHSGGLVSGRRWRVVRKWSPELEDGRWLGFGRRWRTYSGGSCVVDDGGSCVVVDSGKKMGRWREGGKNLGGSSELKKMEKWL